MARTIDVVSLYPKDMNIYGDSGNVLTIRRRLELYGYEPVVHQYNQGDDWPDQVDLILGGGGQDTGQKKIIDDFYHRADLLRSLAAQAVDLIFLLQLHPGGFLPVVPQAELLPAVHPVQLFPEGPVIGGIEIQAGDPVASIRPGVGVVGKQAAQPAGEHQILLERDPVFVFVAH